MPERHKLPGYIVGLNIAMAVIFIALCIVGVMLGKYAMDLGWDTPKPESSNISVTAEAPSDTQ